MAVKLILIKILIVFLSVSQSAWAALPMEPANTPTVQGPPSDQFWAMGAAVRMLRYFGDQNNDVHGFSGEIQFGSSWFYGPKFQLNTMLGVMAGPWQRVRNNSFDSDFNGYGGSVDGRYCFMHESCRTGTWVPSLSLGIGYLDLSGRSIGPNRNYDGDPTNRENTFLESNYLIKLSGFVLTPSFAWSTFEKPRPTGNTLDLLTTRMEGVSVKVGVDIPVNVYYRASFKKRDDDQSISQLPKDKTESGRSRGFSIVMAIQAWLGT